MPSRDYNKHPKLKTSRLNCPCCNPATGQYCGKSARIARRLKRRVEKQKLKGEYESDS